MMGNDGIARLNHMDLELVLSRSLHANKSRTTLPSALPLLLGRGTGKDLP